MSNYTKITDFAAKDALAPGNPSKIITGTAHDNEYNAIATAIATKADSANAVFTGTFTLGGVSLTATATELNKLAGSTCTAAEFNYLTGVTSAIQTQLDAKLASATAASTYQTQAGMSSYMPKSGGAFTGAVTNSSTFTASDFIISSDARLKKDIRRLQDTGAKIDALAGYSFTFRDSGVKRVGVIAQEVRQVLPDIVHVGGDGFLRVSEGALVALLIEEVKALRARVAAVEAR